MATSDPMDSIASLEMPLLDPKAQVKEARKQREIAAIQESIASGTYPTKRDRVAGLLNMFPETRDSDVSLTLRYWETFQSDIYEAGSIPPKLLFKLERQTTIARLRAKIQNDYGLFPSSEGIRSKRRQKEEDVREEMLSDNPISRLISIYADETGKGDQYLIVGSVWFLNAMKSAIFQQKVNSLCHNRKIKNEFHYSRCGKQDVENYLAFIDLVCDEREFLSFKTMATSGKQTSRNVEEVLRDLYTLLALKGLEHEVSSHRIDLPRRISLTIDEGGLNSIGCEMLKQNLAAFLDRAYKQNASLDTVAVVNSKISAALQVADMISGIANRKLNYKGERTHKDDIADYAIGKLGLSFEESIVNDDAFAHINI